MSNQAEYRKGSTQYESQDDFARTKGRDDLVRT